MAVFRVRPFEKNFFEATLENSRRLILDYELVGPLPGELASTTMFTAGIGAASKSPNADEALIKFLTGRESTARLKTKGFEPG